MKQIVMILMLALSIGTAISQNKGIIFFHGSLKQAIEKAKQENKMVFMDAYASWCYPCKMMEKRVFTNTKVGNYYNDHFVSVKIDMEKGEGVELKSQLDISAYPTLFYIDGDGNVVRRSLGYHSTRQLIGIGRDLLKGVEQE